MTIGVLISKSITHLSKNGHKFVTWRLSDLDGNTVSVTLYTNAYKDHFQDSLGGVVYINQYI